MTVILQHKNLTIELFDDPTLNQSANSPISYNKIIQANDDKGYTPSSQHAINIYESDIFFTSAIILASRGGTGILDDSALIDEDNLIIRCSNKLFSLTLPDLEVNWVTEPDWATCFSIHKYQDTYISHGETSIARIDRTGKILWSYGGADIFVCLDESNPFEMHDSYIDLTDFNGSTYRIDYDGNTIDHKESAKYKQEKLIEVMAKTKKPWWRFW
jgi:hypothetical protein